MKSRRKKPSASVEQWDRLLAVTSSRLEVNKMAGVPPAGTPRGVIARQGPSQTDLGIAQILASIASSVTRSVQPANGPPSAQANGILGMSAIAQQQKVPLHHSGSGPQPLSSQPHHLFQTGPMKQEDRLGPGSMAMSTAPPSNLGNQSQLTLQPLLNGLPNLPSPPLANGHLFSPPPPRCCPREVPEILLQMLDHESTPLLEHLRLFFPFQRKMCHDHLQKFVQTSLIFLLEKEATRTTPPLIYNPIIPAASTAPPVGVPKDVLSAAANEEPPAKRQRIDGSGCDSPYYDCVVAGSQQTHGVTTDHSPVLERVPTPGPTSIIGGAPTIDHASQLDHAPKLDVARDEAFRRQVMQELHGKPGLEKGKTHGDVTARLILKLLQVCESPDTSEALLLSGQEAAARMEAGVTDCPIFTDGQQQFSWAPDSRPIEEIFRRMENLNRNVSVQVPSRKYHLRSFEKHKLLEVQQRFLEAENADTDDPWNILDLRNPLPPTVMPKFLAAENCQLLSRVRDAVLSGSSGERTVAAKEKWNEWLDVMDWVLLSEGGHHTAPHMDSHGLSTWITIQEGEFGFGWLSKPTKEERDAWVANPQEFTGGRWRFTVLTPGKTVFFNSGTIHFVFRLRHGQTLALGGHILQWSGIERWITVVRDQMRSPQITNEDVEWSAPKYVRVVSDLVTNRVKSGRVDEIGGQQVVDRFLALVQEFEKDMKDIKKEAMKEAKPPAKKRKR